MLQLYTAEDVGVCDGTGTMKLCASTGIMCALVAECVDCDMNELATSGFIDAVDIDGVMNELASTGFIDADDPMGLSSRLPIVTAPVSCTVAEIGVATEVTGGSSLPAGLSGLVTRFPRTTRLLVCSASLSKVSRVPRTLSSGSDLLNLPRAANSEADPRDPEEAI